MGQLTNVRQPSVKFRLFANFINSGILYTLAYLLIFAIYQLTTAGAAYLSEVKTTVFYDEILFENARWTRSNVVLTFASAPVICLLLGILSHSVYNSVRRTPSFFRLLLLWISLHSFNFFFGGTLAGVLTNTQFGYALSWLSLPAVFKNVLAGSAVVVMLLIGYLFTPYFLKVSFSKRLVTNHRRRYILHTVLFPWIAGTAFLVLLRASSHNIAELILHFTMLLTIVPICNFYGQIPIERIRLAKPSFSVGVSVKYAVVLFVVFLVVRLGFAYGLTFNPLN